MFNKKSQDNGSAAKTKKSGGYFLELDETGNVKSDAAAPVTAPAPETPAATAPAATAPAATPKAKTKTSVKKATAKVAPAPTVAPSNPRVEPEPGVTFAPSNLLPLTTNSSRRRPGPSMNGFLDMASQMKTK
ncbi:MAG TPA: hypothetical protein DEG17_02000 [Cyanobacteria bacterium UBA11149]|nr:hypothetical protein [Cyanobacteria bacterium UBA11367]HBE57858.1 hypothetical protein [Cyanobacteria bacterium UBA11366]HBK61967.1 hypothetical protein [Cyanobacteria bacterium UBA11166]HBR76532.1 hypothetical protein [Cyanobacteria bacterium UBA11159]HBS67659.1 hypothetical protein [Cyanobacteria bacterium UBA11153]HBW87681.1 hypothetical protein [Cyanobacteria bacterium UBA11149]HCA96480.1 hypothetical protein [Cyanobacteria bacterium UBA9226]